MKILLLAGTSEARKLATVLVEQGHNVTASLAGATRAPLDLAGDTRIGGFGGDAGFESWLDQHPVDLIIDATHPFAHRVTNRTARVCRARGITLLQVNRPEWSPKKGDKWHMVDAPSDVRSYVAAGSKVFLATGRQTLHGYANLSECHLYCRQIDPPEAAFPFPNGEYVVGRPPFSIQEEIELFKRLQIDVLVVKNAGGDMSRSKLDAARELGLPVVMIRRPARPDGPIVSSVKKAMDWVADYAQD